VQQIMLRSREQTPDFKRIACLLLLAALAAYAEMVQANEWKAQRQKMVEAVRIMTLDTADYLGKDTLTQKVLTALGQVPRHQFVPPMVKRFAYRNRPLPIGMGQTISQPYIVALMTDLLEPEPHHTVLEVGTGSGYQAAVLAALVKQVYTIEIIPALGNEARQRLQELDYGNIEVKIGDGFYGWPDKGPFDSIIVTAAGNQVPPPLLQQLKTGGKMVLPIGDLFSVQYLVVVEKHPDGDIRSRQILPVQFVPLTGDH